MTDDKPRPTTLPVARILAKAETHAAELDLAKSALGDMKDLIVEFFRTAVSNPATGWVAAMIVNDIAYRAKLIDDATFKAIFIGLSAAFAVDVTIEAVSGVENALTFGLLGGGGGGSNTDLIKPVTQTVVQSPTSRAGADPTFAARLMGLVRGAGAAGPGEVAIPAGAML